MNRIMLDRYAERRGFVVKDKNWKGMYEAEHTKTRRKTLSPTLAGLRRGIDRVHQAIHDEFLEEIGVY